MRAGRRYKSCRAPPRLSAKLPAPLAQAGIARELAARPRRLDPRLVRSEIKARSSCATAPNTATKHTLRRRCVDRVAQRPEMRAAVFEPLDRIEEMVTDRAKRSRRTTTRTVAGLDFPHEAASSGRARDAPEAGFAKKSRRSRAVSSSVCASVVWSSVKPARSPSAGR